MTGANEESPSADREAPISPALQFAVGIGGAIVMTFVLFAVAFAGVPIRGAAWVAIFLAIWLLTFVTIRLRFYSLVAGFMFGSFAMLFLLRALGYPVF